MLTVVFLMLLRILPAQTLYHVDSLTLVIDGKAPAFSNVLPGDTLQLEPGQRDFILIRNFNGEEGRPVIFRNGKGSVTINTNHYYGISISNSSHIRLTGTGDSLNYYGIRIERVQNGAGIGAGPMVSDVELDHVYIANTATAGIYAKTEPDCSFESTRGNFTQYDTRIHDNYIEKSDDEAIYTGSSKYLGVTLNCNGRDTLVYPSLLDGVRIYNNIIRYTGWDGIQVSSAYRDCRVYGNIILYDSQDEYNGQMAGILLGGGSKCDCYNNFISQGVGDGIEYHGLGGNKLYNNIIVDAGRLYQPADSSLMRHGIFVSDISMMTDSSLYLLNNDIIHPKSDGIRFASVKSRNNLIASNLIVDPGNYDLYEKGNTGFKGVDSYVMFPDNSAEVVVRNNFFTRVPAEAGYSTENYTLLPGSPLIDSAYSGMPKVTFDFYRRSRPYGEQPDIGALEFYPGQLGIDEECPDQPSPLLAFPNPVDSELNLHFDSAETGKGLLTIFDLQGKRVLAKSCSTTKGELNRFSIRLDALSPGLFIYRFDTGQQSFTGKFVVKR
jgi:hypothetical protein